MNVISTLIKVSILLCIKVTLAFEQGAGAQYDFSLNGQSSRLDIYITESKFNKISIEYYFFAHQSLFGSKMWQQFELSLTDNRVVGIKNGYFDAPQLKNPQILTKKYFHLNDGVQLNTFIMVNKDEIKKYKVGSEQIEVPAGTIYADHYRQIKNGQTLDYWISETVRPIGLVKLKSTHQTKKNQQYTIEMTSLLKNVKPKIDPKEAIKLNAKGKKLIEP